MQNSHFDNFELSEKKKKEKDPKDQQFERQSFRVIYHNIYFKKRSIQYHHPVKHLKSTLNVARKYQRSWFECYG